MGRCDEPLQHVTDESRKTPWFAGTLWEFASILGKVGVVIVCVIFLTLLFGGKLEWRRRLWTLVPEGAKHYLTTEASKKGPSPADAAQSVIDRAKKVLKSVGPGPTASRSKPESVKQVPQGSGSGATAAERERILRPNARENRPGQEAPAVDTVLQTKQSAPQKR